MHAIINRFMKARQLFFLFCLLGIASGAQGQDVLTQNIHWSVSQAVDLRTSASRTESFEVRTSDTQIEIIQGQVSKSFRIISKDGTWQNLTSDGTVVYQLNYGGKTGSGTLQRVNGQYSFILDFSGHKDGLKQKFVISSYEVK